MVILPEQTMRVEDFRGFVFQSDFNENDLPQS